MFGLIKLPTKAHPGVLATLQSAISDSVEINDIKPRSPLYVYRGLPREWGSFLDTLVDTFVMSREARSEPYIHRPLEDVARRHRRWLSCRLRHELRARTALSKIRTARLTSAVTWNGQVGDPAIVAFALRQLQIPTLYAELSPFKGRYFLDHIGVNGASSLQAVRPEDLDPYEDEEELFSQLKENYLGRRTSTTVLNDPRDLPRTFIFAPLQVPTDTQILLHGGGIRRHSEYLDILRQVLPQLPRGVTLVVKPHPSAPYSASYLRDTIGREIFVASDYETRDLLERCAGIVTVNSSIGVDGFLFDKPVIAIGNAPWIKPALARQARTAKEIAEAIADLPKFDKRLRQRFIAHWYHAYTWREFDEPTVVREFVEGKLAAAQQSLVETSHAPSGLCVPA
jgi:hypothetical protein